MFRNISEYVCIPGEKHKEKHSIVVYTRCVCTVCPRKVYREECDGKGGECVTLFEYSCRRGSPLARTVSVFGILAHL